MTSGDLGPQLQTSVVAKARTVLEIQLDVVALEALTTASVPHLRRRVKDFVDRVLKEARSIEEAEHVGSGPPEITAAHIDEAWWVSRRRVRRSRHPMAKAGARAAQLFGGAGFGIGATHLQQTWGAALFIVSTLVLLGALLLEGHLTALD
ncbi:MAG: hypothetical protein ABSF73_01905 [Terriglobia bacterium]|jgi:hypothetical protein